MKDEGAIAVGYTFDVDSAGVGYANLNARLWPIDGAVKAPAPVDITVDDHR